MVMKLQQADLLGHSRRGRHALCRGVTRGKRLFVLLGQKKAVAIAAKNVSGRWRWSKLREWLSPF
jgi:exodeoxyribonuclease V alpha subunit